MFYKEGLKEYFTSCVNLIKKKIIEEEIENLQKTISSAKDIAEKRELVLKLSQKIKDKQNLNKVN